MIIEIPNYLSPENVEHIKNTVSPFVGKTPYVTYNREGDTLPVSKTPELKELDLKLFGIFTEIQKNIVAPRYKPMFESADTGYEYHKYSPGDMCLYHTDGEVVATTTPNKFNLRYASVVLHLTTNDDGGELIFPNQNKKIKTEAGKLVVFPPHTTFGHYTTPSTQPREVLMTWFVYDGMYVSKE
jgi:predicted 2-oxoglutarate/Fe(II)-dependent dioxygenase YbiX